MHPAILSLHDVMPETFPQLEAILKYLRDHDIPPITLLVVPGRGWQPRQIRRLRELSEQGHTLAAHGWVHQTGKAAGIYHRIHSSLISRNVAEHLALDAGGIHHLMQRSYNWFAENELPSPSLYVPPAWALGNIPRKQLASLPYTAIEVLRGLHLPQSGQFTSLPMIGFEANTAFRVAAVRTWNAWQSTIARAACRPLRIGMHPMDFQLAMAENLRHLLAQPFIWQNYDEALEYIGHKETAAS